MEKQRKKRIAYNKIGSVCVDEMGRICGEDYISDIMESMNLTHSLSEKNIVSFQQLQEFRNQKKSQDQNNDTSTGCEQNSSVNPKQTKSICLKKNFPLMAKCQKNLKILKHNRCIPKPRAHVGSEIKPLKTQSLQAAKSVRKIEDGKHKLSKVSTKRMPVPSPKKKIRKKKKSEFDSSEDTSVFKGNSVDGGDIKNSDNESDSEYEKFLKLHHSINKRKISTTDSDSSSSENVTTLSSKKLKSVKRKKKSFSSHKSKVVKTKHFESVTEEESISSIRNASEVSVNEEANEDVENEFFDDNLVISSAESDNDISISPIVSSNLHLNESIINVSKNIDAVSKPCSSKCNANVDSSSENKKISSECSKQQFGNSDLRELNKNCVVISKNTSNLVCDHQSNMTVNDTSCTGASRTIEEALTSEHSSSSNIDCLTVNDTSCTDALHTIEEALTSEHSSSSNNGCLIAGQGTNLVYGEKINGLSEQSSVLLEADSVVSIQIESVFSLGDLQHTKSLSKNSESSDSDIEVIIVDNKSKSQNQSLLDASVSHNMADSIEEDVIILDSIKSTDTTKNVPPVVSKDFSSEPGKNSKSATILSVTNKSSQISICQSIQGGNPADMTMPQGTELSKSIPIDITAQTQYCINDRLLPKDVKASNITNKPKDSTSVNSTSSTACSISTILGPRETDKDISTTKPINDLAVFETLKQIDINLIKKFIESSTSLDCTRNNNNESLKTAQCSKPEDEVICLDSDEDVKPIIINSKNKLISKPTTSAISLNEINKHEKACSANKMGAELKVNAASVHTDQRDIVDKQPFKSEVTKIKYNRAAQSSSKHSAADIKHEKCRVKSNSDYKLQNNVKLEDHCNNVSDELDIIATSSIEEIDNIKSVNPLLLLDLYREEYEKYKEVRSTEKNVSAGLKLLEENQLKKLKHLVIAIKKISAKDPCFQKVAHMKVNQSKQKYSKTNDSKIIGNASSTAQSPESNNSSFKTCENSKPQEDRKVQTTKAKVHQSLQKFKCVECDKPAFAACQGCAKVYYCSKECGEIFWNKGHSVLCEK